MFYDAWTKHRLNLNMQQIGTYTFKYKSIHPYQPLLHEKSSPHASLRKSSMVTKTYSPDCVIPRACAASRNSRKWPPEPRERITARKKSYFIVIPLKVNELICSYAHYSLYKQYIPCACLLAFSSIPV